MSTMAQPGVEVTGGVDTHKDTHVAAALDQLGRVLGTAPFPATPAGYRQLAGWLTGFGQITAVGVEGTGAWGAGLARHLAGNDVTVVEVQRPNRQHRRRHGKSDPADAIAAARAVQSGEADGAPKTGDGAVESVRMLRLARNSAVKARTQAANQIHAVINTAPEQLRTSLEGRSISSVAHDAARFRPGDLTTPMAAAKRTLLVLSRRWLALTAEIKELDHDLDQLTAATAPTLRALTGVGVHNAATLLSAAGDNPDRLNSEASFAALCGTSPVDASSGRQQRHRLNRGGNRNANAALHLIVITRLRWDQPTRDYMQRRLAEGKTKKEIIRCLKRYVARQIHHAIQTDLTTPQPT